MLLTSPHSYSHHSPPQARALSIYLHYLGTNHLLFCLSFCVCNYLGQVGSYLGTLPTSRPTNEPTPLSRKKENRKAKESGHCIGPSPISISIHFPLTHSKNPPPFLFSIFKHPRSTLSTSHDKKNREPLQVKKDIRKNQDKKWQNDSPITPVQSQRQPRRCILHPRRIATRRCVGYRCLLPRLCMFFSIRFSPSVSGSYFIYLVFPPPTPILQGKTICTDNDSWMDG